MALMLLALTLAQNLRQKLQWRPDFSRLTQNPAYQFGYNAGMQKLTPDSSVEQNGGMIERIAGGIMTVVLVAIVLNEMLTLTIVNQSTGPMSDLIDQATQVGTAALTLAVLGFLAAAATLVLNFFRGGF
ncbi:hypothetical protein DVK02_14945 [Halobellus sp. Atlit-31R]|nr:hypothetical protein DVK02_14945 [Halobellus sp. Atlit-31R]